MLIFSKITDCWHDHLLHYQEQNISAPQSIQIFSNTVGKSLTFLASSQFISQAGLELKLPLLQQPSPQVSRIKGVSCQTQLSSHSGKLVVEICLWGLATVNSIFQSVRILVLTNGHIFGVLVKATMVGTGCSLQRLYKTTPGPSQVYSLPEQTECVSIHSGSLTAGSITCTHWGLNIRAEVMLWCPH